MGKNNQINKKRLWCKLCNEIRLHADIGIDSTKWKCMYCGEYNQATHIPKKLSPEQSKEE